MRNFAILIFAFMQAVIIAQADPNLPSNQIDFTTDINENPQKAFFYTIDIGGECGTYGFILTHKNRIGRASQIKFVFDPESGVDRMSKITHTIPVSLKYIVDLGGDSSLVAIPFGKVRQEISERQMSVNSASHCENLLHTADFPITDIDIENLKKAMRSRQNFN